MLDTLYCIDMDRCTLNTAAVMEYLRSVLEELGVDHETAIKEREAAIKQGGTIDVWAHLHKHALDTYGISEDQLAQAVLRRAPDESFLYPSVVETLGLLQGRVIVMTFGNYAWQSLKAKLSGIDQYAPLCIVNTHRKAELIAQAQVPGGYALRMDDAEYRARRIVLVDDKAEAFAGLPADCAGYQLNNGEWLPFQEGDLPSTVKLLSGGFQEFIHEERL